MPRLINGNTLQKGDPTVKDKLREALADPRRPRWRSKRALAQYLGCADRTLQCAGDLELWRLAWQAVGKSEAQIEAKLCRMQGKEPVAKPEPKCDLSILDPILARFNAAWAPGYIFLDGAVTILGRKNTAGNRRTVIKAAQQAGLYLVAWERRGSTKIHACSEPLKYLLVNDQEIARTEFWEIVISLTPWACDWQPNGPQKGRGHPVAPKDLASKEGDRALQLSRIP